MNELENDVNNNSAGFADDEDDEACVGRSEIAAGINFCADDVDDDDDAMDLLG